MDIEHTIIATGEHFPNNSILPVLLYKKVFKNSSPKKIRSLFESNGWHNFWVNGIYTFHHFHSNTHEVLGVASGSCTVQLGGEEGAVFQIESLDCLLIPAGVAHKNIGSSDDFLCVGGYPTSIPYDMQKETKETSKMSRQIEQVPQPKTDPVFGNQGPIFDYWIKGKK